MKRCIQKFLGLILIILFIISNFSSIDANYLKQENVCENSFEDSSIYELLIITADEYTGILRKLIDHKETYGISTKMVTIDEVYDRMFWQGRDKPEKIKYFIKQALDEWKIKYVLFVGNFKKIPVRYVYNDESWEGYPEPYYISELYYADIYDDQGKFSTWDYNNNGIFGEWRGESAQDRDIELRPDVYLGRLACRNRLEVRIMVEKIITYETTTYGSDWFNRFAVICGDTYPLDEFPAIEGEDNARLAFENMSGFEPVELFTSNGNFTGPRDVIRVFNQGCGFIAFDGHAGPISCMSHAPYSHDWIKGLDVFTMTFLINKNRYPVVIAGACHNNQFDIEFKRIFTDDFSHSTWFPECWGWKLTRKIGGGAIATIANTGLGMSKEDKDSREGAGDYMDLQFFYEYGTNNTPILGECWGKAIDRYLDAFPIDWDTPSSWDYAYDLKTVQQWVLLGDPSLMIGGYPQKVS